MRRSKKALSYTVGDIVGWYGVIAILIAYGGVTFELLSVRSLLYPILNLTGSFGILYEAWIKKDWPASVLNIIWALIAFVEILKI